MPIEWRKPPPLAFGRGQKYDWPRVGYKLGDKTGQLVLSPLAMQMIGGYGVKRIQILIAGDEDTLWAFKPVEEGGYRLAQKKDGGSGYLACVGFLKQHCGANTSADFYLVRDADSGLCYIDIDDPRDETGEAR